jgi:choice-of-anchor C domain-containing protein
MRFLVATVASLLLAGAASAATIVNGSFEAGVNPPSNNFTPLGAGNTNITGWTIGGGGVDWIGTFWQASDGTRSVDMTAITAGLISQDIATIVGQRYIVSFDLAGNPNPSGGPTLKSLDVSINGSGLANYTFDTAGFTRSDMGWISNRYSFIADSATSTLTFASNNGFASGPALDNVTIAVPEPTTWAMLIMGFGLVGAAKRRRRTIVIA